MARTKLDPSKPKHERIAKSTSIGRRPKTSSMNKHKKNQLKNTEVKVDDAKIISYIFITR